MRMFQEKKDWIRAWIFSFFCCHESDDARGENPCFPTSVWTPWGPNTEGSGNEGIVQIEFLVRRNVILFISLNLGVSWSNTYTFANILYTLIALYSLYI